MLRSNTLIKSDEDKSFHEGQRIKISRFGIGCALQVCIEGTFAAGTRWLRNMQKVEGDRLEMEMDKNYSGSGCWPGWYWAFLHSLHHSSWFQNHRVVLMQMVDLFSPPSNSCSYSSAGWSQEKPRGAEINLFSRAAVVKHFGTVCVSVKTGGEKNQGDSAFTLKLHSMREKKNYLLLFALAAPQKKKSKPPSTPDFNFQEGIWPHCVTRWNISVISAVCFPSHLS